MNGRPDPSPRPVEILIGNSWVPATAHAEHHDRRTGAWTLVSYSHDHAPTLAWTLTNHVRPPRKPRQT
jgi:hypothetical protein